jgi:hypothetical protein
MELIEKIEDLNFWLKRDYGCHTDGRPWFRIVFSEGLLEKRWMTHTDDGFQLLYPEVREVPKYNYIKEKYVLERIVTIIPGVETDLVEREPYEILWTFMDRFENYLSPRFAACKFIIEQIYENKRQGIRKIKNPADEIEEEQRLEDMEEFLFGNETPVGDALRYGSGVTVSIPRGVIKNA